MVSDFGSQGSTSRKRRPRTRVGLIAACTTGAIVALGVGGFVLFHPHAPAKPARPAAHHAPPEGAHKRAPGPPKTIKEGTWTAWEAATDGEPGVYIVDGTVVTMTSKGGGPDESPTPVLTVRSSGAEPFAMEGTEGFESAAANFAVGRFDPDADPNYPQVLLASFTGGAHCCSEYTLLERRGGAWKTVDLGQWDGGLDERGEAPKDLDGDGRADFVFVDNRFLYLVDAYAGSMAPPQILNILDGKTEDVSWNRGFDDQFAADMKFARDACRKEHSNGACAAYLADAARLNRLDEAWPVVRAGYDKDSGWTMPQKCRVPTKGVEECPKGQEVAMAGFPETLEWLLVDMGYIRPSQARYPTSAPTEPDFECAKATGETLKLVCATPELTTADKELAFVYRRALGRANDRETLRREQRAWLARRDQAPGEATALLELYRARINELDAD